MLNMMIHSYADIVAEEIDKQVLKSQFIYLAFKNVGIGFVMIPLYYGEVLLNDFKHFFKT